jgi:hypothetical protein
LDGRLRILGLRDGNGLLATIIPSHVTNVAEDGSWKPNGLEEKLRISLKRGLSVVEAVEALRSV